MFPENAPTPNSNHFPDGTHWLPFHSQNKVWRIDSDATAGKQVFDCSNAGLLFNGIPLRADGADMRILNAAQARQPALIEEGGSILKDAHSNALDFGLFVDLQS